MKYETLFKVDVAGAMRVWFISTDPLDASKYCTTSGLEHGKHVTTGYVTACANTLRCPEDQAAFEIAANYKLQLRTGYSATREDALLGSDFAEPMLCKKYEEKGAQKHLIYGLGQGQWLLQPKLDGIRCIVKADGMYSRTGTRFLSSPHIMEGLADEFARDPNLVLDGELYNHDLHDDFNRLSGLIRKGVNSKKPVPVTAEDLAITRQIVQFHAYDMPSRAGFAAWRLEALADMDFESPFIKVVETWQVNDREHGDQLHEDCVVRGYEGTVYKRASADYQWNARPWDQLKRKDFETEEFELLRIEEGDGDWKGKAKRLVFRWPPTGGEFATGLRGSMEFAAELLTRTDIKSCTVRFMPPPKGAVPRVGVAIDFHGAEGRVD